ncbi:MAG: hypothetical protein PVG39_08445 [Desulfobacteraceae bacterium]|jgi:hypothetical protein
MHKENLATEIMSFNFLLPKKLEETEEGANILAVLKSRMKPIKPGHGYMIPSFPVSQSIINALYSARRTGRLIRGIEDAEKKLAAERTGIENAEIKSGSGRKGRISRLAIIANDGSDRFYRQTKKLVEQNRPRVLAIHLDVTSFELGERLFGPGKRSVFLLINHKDAVIKLLTSLIK